MPAGRPTEYNPEVAARICYLVQTEAKGIKKLCEENEDIPSFQTIFNWLNDPEKPEFLDQYTRARGEQADTIADRMLDVAFEPSKTMVQAQDKRTQIDALKWIASKLKPKKYGDKVDVTTDGEKINSVKVEIIHTDAPLSGSEKEVKLD